MISIGIYVGGMVIDGPMGSAYNLPPRTVFTSDVNITLDFLRRLIYQHLGLLESQCRLQIRARVNVGGTDSVFYSLLPISDDHRLSAVVGQTQSMLELYVDIIPHISSTSYVPTGDNLPGSSNQASWNVPQHQPYNIPHYEHQAQPQYPPQYRAQPQYPPQYQPQAVNPYYQTTWNAPRYQPPNVPEYEYQAPPDYSHYDTQPHYSPQPPPNVPQASVPQDSEYHGQPDYSYYDTHPHYSPEPPPNIPEVSIPQERSAEPNANEPTVRGAADDDVDPGEDLYNSGNESPLYDTDDEEAERMAEEDEGEDDSSSSSDDNNTPFPGSGPPRQVPQPFLNRAKEQPFRFFHSSATEEVESDSITYGVKKAFDHPLAVGRKFADKEALVAVVQEYHINENRPYKPINSSKTMYVAECEHAPLCKWRLYAVSKDKKSFTIKTNPYTHSCEAIIGRRDHRQLTAKFLAKVLYNSVAANPGISMRDLSSVVEAKFDQKPTYNKLWRAKEKAIAATFGSWSEAYALLPN